MAVAPQSEKVSFRTGAVEVDKITRIFLSSEGPMSLYMHEVQYCDRVEARPRSGRRPSVAEAEMAGNVKIEELTDWQEVGWTYLLDMARSSSF